MLSLQVVDYGNEFRRHKPFFLTLPVRMVKLFVKMGGIKLILGANFKGSSI
jgi:hypothetical protein